MKAIGGYFGLELPAAGNGYHAGAVPLNTGRNALSCILSLHQYEKIYIPHLICDDLLKTIVRLRVVPEFYPIDKNLEPVFDFSIIKEKEAFLYINYWGLKNQYTIGLKRLCKNLIIDNAQSFFSLPLPGVDTFYSARKFFGVPDGAYLYHTADVELNLIQDHSLNRFEHLVRRLDNDAEDGYPFFLQNEKLLDDVPPMHMSRITETILNSIDYETVASKRRENYAYLAEHLVTVNLVHFELNNDDVPMTYPFLTNDRSLRKKLIAQKIYTAQYWHGVLERTEKDSIEYQYAENLIHLPIDQRYGRDDTDTIINLLR